jgi:hypothetical protein
VQLATVVFAKILGFLDQKIQIFPDVLFVLNLVFEAADSDAADVEVQI